MERQEYAMEEIQNIPPKKQIRKKKRSMERIIKEDYLPYGIAALTLILVIIFIGCAIGRAVEHHKAEEIAASIAGVIIFTKTLNSIGNDFSGIDFNAVFIFIRTVSHATFDINQRAFAHIVAAELGLFVKADDCMPFSFSRFAKTGICCHSETANFFTLRGCTAFGINAKATDKNDFIDHE
jgi:cell division protein FtsL